MVVKFWYDIINFCMYFANQFFKNVIFIISPSIISINNNYIKIIMVLSKNHLFNQIYSYNKYQNKNFWFNKGKKIK